MLDKRIPLQIDQAIKKIMDYSKEGESENVSIDDCDERYLSETIIATHDVPLFTRSGYDGYALRSTDTANASPNQPIELKVLEVLGAGKVPTIEIGAFETSRIMTGAMLPKGCDAVIMLEAVKEIEKNGEKYIVIKREMRVGANISYQGEEVKGGEVILTKGTKINPGAKAVLATFGYATVPVTKKPTVGILATGTELLEVNELLRDGKIRNSNSHMISSQIKRVGAEPIYFGKLPDEIDTCLDAVVSALKKVDILITTGGVSVGDFDYMPEVYKRMGAEILFNKVKMRPGSVTTVAEYNGKLLFGLSGNPSACFVGFELFVRPIIRKWHLNKNPHLKKISAFLDTDIEKATAFTRFVRSKLLFKEQGLFVTPSGIDKSNIVTSLVHTDSLLLLPGTEKGFKKGETVEVFLLEDQEGSLSAWNY